MVEQSLKHVSFDRNNFYIKGKSSSYSKEALISSLQRKQEIQLLNKDVSKAQTVLVLYKSLQQ